MPQRTFSGLILRLLVPALAAVWIAAAHAGAGAPADPLDSARWEDMRKAFFPDARVVFDERVRVSSPEVAENPMQVPVTVSAEGLGPVQEILVFADFNPILKVLQFYPHRARPSLSFRIKLQQSSPVRAAARTADGVWHVGGTWVQTTGGGCSAPSAGRANADWARTLGTVRSRVWQQAEGDRVRLRIEHPMDTGLAAGIPAFFLQHLALRSPDGAPLLELDTFEPVSENPVFTFDLTPGSAGTGKLRITGVDNNGNRISGGIGP